VRLGTHGGGLGARPVLGLLWGVCGGGVLVGGGVRGGGGGGLGGGRAPRAGGGLAAAPRYLPRLFRFCFSDPQGRGVGGELLSRVNRVPVGGRNRQGSGGRPASGGSGLGGYLMGRPGCCAGGGSGCLVLATTGGRPRTDPPGGGRSAWSVSGPRGVGWGRPVRAWGCSLAGGSPAGGGGAVWRGAADYGGRGGLAPPPGLGRGAVRPGLRCWGGVWGGVAAGGGGLRGAPRGGVPSALWARGGGVRVAAGIRLVISGRPGAGFLWWAPCRRAGPGACGVGRWVWHRLPVPSKGS